MEWAVAMLFAGALLGLTGNLAQKTRAWLTMMVAWLCGALVVAVWGYFPPPVVAFMFIDGLSAWFVLKRPRSLGQQLVGTIFVMLLAWHIGFYLTDHVKVKLYVEVQIWLGWIQWGVLMFWGGADAGKALGLWPWHNRAVAAVADDIGAGR